MTREEKISAYISGQLEESERKTFEQKMLTDQELREEVELEQLIFQGGIELGLKEIENSLKEVYKGKRRQRWSIKALIILSLIALTIVLIWPKHLKEDAPPKNTIKAKSKQLINAGPTKVIIADSLSTANLVENKTVEASQIERAQIDQPIAIHTKQIDTTVRTIKSPLQKPGTLKEEESQPKPKKDPCLTTQLKISKTTQATCENKSKGVIVIQSVTGGLAPYTIQVDGLPLLSSNAVSNLNEGYHELLITDNNQCELSLEFEIEAVFCYEPEKGFNPDFESWEYQNEQNQLIKISIVNKRGIQVFNTETTEDFIWDGRANGGDILPIGLYIYQIEFDNGNMIQGSVSIIE